LTEKRTLFLLYRSSKKSFAGAGFTPRVGVRHRDSYKTLVAFHQSKRSIYQKLTFLRAFTGGSIKSCHWFGKKVTGLENITFFFAEGVRVPTLWFVAKTPCFSDDKSGPITCWTLR
jgi:hypothetical protein